MNAKNEFPVIFFETQKKWRDWLLKNHSKSDGVWLQLYKKNSGIKSIDHDQALNEALCFGWIPACRQAGTDRQKAMMKNHIFRNLLRAVTGASGLKEIQKELSSLLSRERCMLRA
jgi:uncharacterized protein YdeI (YjbR/CyaY-like superfamily)